MSEKTYEVLNYCSNPVVVATKHESIQLPAAEGGQPSSYPFTLEEIRYINMSGSAFKSGSLTFEEEDKEKLFDELRIRNWKEILSNKQIEDIILNPSAKGLEKLIYSKDAKLICRVYGIYIGLKNAGYSLAGDVSKAIQARYAEVAQGKMTTDIVISQKATEKSVSQEEFDKLKKQIEDMQSIASKSEERSVNESVAKVDSEPVKKAATPKAKAQTSSPKSKKK